MAVIYDRDQIKHSINLHNTKMYIAKNAAKLKDITNHSHRQKSCNLLVDDLNDYDYYYYYVRFSFNGPSFRPD